MIGTRPLWGQLMCDQSVPELALILNVRKTSPTAFLRRKDLS